MLPASPERWKRRIEFVVPHLLPQSPNTTRGAFWARIKRNNDDARIRVEAKLRIYKRPELPVRVTMTRCSKGSLDSDNLVASFKHIRDVIARWLGIDDANWQVEWECKQIRWKVAEVRIQILEIDPPPPKEPMPVPLGPARLARALPRKR